MEWFIVINGLQDIVDKFLPFVITQFPQSHAATYVVGAIRVATGAA
jgi:hypothetical protein